MHSPLPTITENGVVWIAHRCKWDGMSTWVLAYCGSYPCLPKWLRVDV